MSIRARLKTLENKLAPPGWCAACGGIGVYCLLEAEGEAPYPAPQGCARCGRVAKIAMIRRPVGEPPTPRPG